MFDFCLVMQSCNFHDWRRGLFHLLKLSSWCLVTVNVLWLLLVGALCCSAVCDVSWYYSLTQLPSNMLLQMVDKSVCHLMTLPFKTVSMLMGIIMF